MQTARQQFPPLELVNKPNVDTAHAAYLLTRRPQTLRAWACMENGPLRPVRINGRLAWPGLAGIGIAPRAGSDTMSAALERLAMANWCALRSRWLQMRRAKS